MHNIKIVCAFAFAGASFLAAATAWSATETQNLNVSATITNTCNISTSNSLAFGTVEPTSNTATNADVTISVTCSAAPTAASIEVGDGLNAGLKSTHSAARAMKRVGASTPTDDDYLAYKLYSDSARSSEISLTSGSSSQLTLTTLGTSMSKAIYGQVPPSQTAGTSGSYNSASFTDTVLLTFTYTP